MGNFENFAAALNKRFTSMSKNELYVVGDHLDRDSLWLTYLDSFPAGTDPIYKERTEHNCNTCKQFVVRLGNVVEIVDGQVRTIWSPVNPSVRHVLPYDDVALAMDKFVRSLPLTSIFRTTEGSYGAEKTRSLIQTNSGGHDPLIETWNHFHAKVANRHRLDGEEIGPARSQFEASVQVFRRGLEELSPSAVETVIDLIDNNSLYRGEEHLRAVTEFRTLQNRYRQNASDAFVFANANNPVSRFRNTVIGTLVGDLSSGVELEQAVRSFESKVAPLNYKRPKALITASMVKNAMKTINELGIESALERRFATLADVSVNDVLWVNNDTAPRMKDGVEGLLMNAVTPTSKAAKGKPEDMTIVQFMEDVLPNATAIEMNVRNDHVNRFVSITTATNADAPRLFKWDNPFAWVYGGNVADSIKERVKKAGGSVTGKLRVSLSWFNTDDLDIHVTEPDGTRIWYGNKTPGNTVYSRNKTPHGKLDVDMNAGSDFSREPVENVTWDSMQNGEYLIVVNQYRQRETSDVGFVIEVESNGSVSHYRYDKPVRGDVEVGKMTVVDGRVVNFAPGAGIVGGNISQEVWGIKTEQYVPVSTVMYSPNYWSGSAVGNKHYMFILRGAINDQPTRGFLNEYLRGDLDQHRKVFEVISDKTKVPASDEQLSGIGFSSTGGGEITARVTMNTGRQRLININF